jgi:DNA-directed RNA polymerase subunit RPC12/RpoP
MLVMSFLESGKKGVLWLPAQIRRSVSLTPGCAVCGRKLEMDAKGVFALSGKCDDCTHRVFDEDEPFDELEY